MRTVFSSEGSRASDPTLRDVLAIGFRQRRAMLGTFVVVLLAAAAVAWLAPPGYVSELKILVRRDRVDSVVTPTRDDGLPGRLEVTAEEIQSEAELITSRDLLSRVVVACGLHRAQPWWTEAWTARLRGGAVTLEGEARRVAAAVAALEDALEVDPIEGTNIIAVTYRAPDPQLARKVLDTLATLYLEKHLALHRPPGAYEFFSQAVEGSRLALSDAEARLAAFARREGAVAVEIERELIARKLAEAETAWRAADAGLEEVELRIAALEAELEAVPARHTTAIRTSDNPQLLQTLKGTLLTLELKRTELVTRFDPSYRLVREVDTQIAQTREAIAQAERSPLRDETTDRDPTFEWLRAELTRARADRASLAARRDSAAEMRRAYAADAKRAADRAIAEHDLVRAAKAEEDHFLLYRRKQEEARISDALDRQRISNLVVAQPATVPATPRSRRALILLAGLVLAGLAAVLVAFARDYFDPSFRTPDEVRAELDVPVVATFPRAAAGRRPGRAGSPVARPGRGGGGRSPDGPRAWTM